MPDLFKTLTIVFGLFVFGHSAAFAQPLLREGDVEDERQTEPDDEELRREAQPEDERLQQELMRMQGERLAAEREEIERSKKMMNYALAIALLVIGTTLLIAFARSRIAADSKPPSTPPAPPGGA